MTGSDPKPFRFKQFSIHHHPDVMKVSTDSVILGSWMNVQNDANILDVGCGNGILSLMAAQKNPNAKIHAVDIQDKAVELAALNFSLSDFKNEAHFVETDILNWDPGISFDHIISNPPYFTNVTPSNTAHKSKARHTSEHFLRDLLIWCDHHMGTKGKISIILPASSLDQFNKVLNELGFHIFRELEIYHKEGNPMSLKAMEVRRDSGFDSTINEIQSRSLVLYDENNGRTAQFSGLCSAFYL